MRTKLCSAICAVAFLSFSAAAKDDVEIQVALAQQLIAAGADLTGTDSNGATAAVLLDAGVDPKKEPYNARALANGNKEILDLLKRRR